MQSHAARRRAVSASARVPAWLAVTAVCAIVAANANATRAVTTTPTAADAAASTALTLDDLFSVPALTGTRPASPAWSPDSRHLAFTWNDQALPQRELWIVSADGSNLRQLPAPAKATTSVKEFVWLPDGNTLLALRGSAIWSTRVDDGHSAMLVAVGDGATDLKLSPDGARATWRRGGDLWLLDLQDATSVPRRLTDVGMPGISSLPVGRYSRPDREIGPGIWSGPTYAWSLDGRHIAVHHVDRRHMRKVPFPDYLAAETSPNRVRRGYPGDANEHRTVGLLDPATGELRLLDLDEPTANQILDFSWSPEGVLLVDIASDTAEDRWLYTVDPDTAERIEIWHSHRASRIYTAFASTWHPDGQHVVLLSDVDDRYRLYSLPAPAPGRPSAAPPEAPAVLQGLTDAAYDVIGPPTVVASAGAIFYTANGVSPYRQDVYRTDVPARGADGARVVADRSSEPRRLTTLPGHNTGYPSPDGQSLAILHSSDTQPTELYVSRAAQSAAPRRVTHSPPAAFDDIPWVAPRYVTFPSRIDDYTLHARILEPSDLDPSRRYPVVFGPVYSNTVRNRWRGIYSLMQQLLVQQGYIVVQVDVRGSTGYGRDFREAFLTDFAGEDIDDLASAVAYLTTLPYVDAERMGIWGSSYGGTLTVYSLLTKPGLFCAGVAAAAAVDPYFFGTDDVAIVRRPDTHPEIFERAARRYAANLEDHLLLIHGMQDHVVPFKTTAVLADALIKAGKDFDFAFAPGATHAWSREPYNSRYLFGKLLAHFDRYLKPEDACSNGD
jgi:dipeptidyl-peptidase-4